MATIRLVKDPWPMDRFAFCGGCRYPVMNTAEDPAYWLERGSIGTERVIICSLCAHHLDVKASIQALVELIEAGIVTFDEEGMS